jgi:KaiC/GvpD/RAD55 family RecA-like ATPase
VTDDYVSPSPQFRRHVIGLLYFSDWLLRYGTIILPEHFPSDDERDAVRWINDYYARYRALPSDADIEHGLHGNDVLEILYEVELDEIRSVSDIALDFARTQAVKLAILAAVDDIQDGNLDGIVGRMKEALGVGSDRLQLGVDVVADVDSWLYDDIHGKRYPTGWPIVDNVLRGGLVEGEYGLILGGPGRGKTTTLINIGYSCAGLMGAANVTHLTYEMPEAKVAKRYATRITGLQPIRGEGSNRFKASLEKEAKRKLKAKLRVVYPDDRSIDGVRRILDNLADDGFETEVLIADYADLMRPTRNRKEKRFELAELSRELREIGHDYGIPVWSASQAGRQSLYKEYVTIADISEAIEKAAIADVIIGICQTMDEEEMGQGRLYLAKVRDGESGVIVPVKMDLERQAIVQRRSTDV